MTSLSIFVIIASYSLTLIFAFASEDLTESAYDLKKIELELLNEYADPIDVRCYGFYGCFPITMPWNSSQRAHNV
jgi:hypothetical protein